MKDELILIAIAVGCLAVLVVTLRWMFGRSKRRINAALAHAADVLNLPFIGDDQDQRVTGKIGSVAVELNAGSVKDLRIQKALMGPIGTLASEPAIKVLARIAPSLPFTMEIRAKEPGSSATTGDEAFDRVCSVHGDITRAAELLRASPEARKAVAAFFESTRRTLTEAALSTSAVTAGDHTRAVISQHRVEVVVVRLDTVPVVTRAAVAAASALSRAVGGRT